VAAATPDDRIASDGRTVAADADAELRRAIVEWRDHMPAVSELAEPVDPTHDHIIGDPAAPLAIVEYGDYQCSECAQALRLRELVDGWLQQGRVCFVFRHFPLVDAHPRALRAAQALEAAAAQDRFADMHDVLMRSDTVIDDSGQEHVVLDARLDEEGLVRSARTLGLDVDRFRAAMDEPATLEHIMRDFRGGVRSGVNGTPTFYLGPERQDVIGPEELVARLERALGRSR
jgi:protein-disulfide isomerase